ncbi:hypothetical protein VTJ04DRAFT_8658 [Mycothermus thermophilus]|uniref:uncharacterized protein n=1 Tax=Humicola insolens TaxID=85995 RepID=UPI003743E615
MSGQLFSGVRSKAGRFDASQDQGNGTLDVAVLQAKAGCPLFRADFISSTDRSGTVAITVAVVAAGLQRSSLLLLPPCIHPAPSRPSGLPCAEDGTEGIMPLFL